MKFKFKFLVWMLNISVVVLVLFQTGCGRISLSDPTSKREIQQRIDDNDALPAFHDVIYDQAATMEFAIPTLKSFLTSSDPYVRYLAAEDLYIAGDNSGCNALIEIMKTSYPVRADGGQDLRVRSAQILLKYHEGKAINALIDYSKKPKNDWVMGNLAKMMGKLLPRDLVQGIRSNSNSIYVIHSLSYVDPQLIKDLALKTFQDSKDLSDTKIYAAWAMLKAGEKEPYYSYLMNFSKIALAGETSATASQADFHFHSLKILASIKSPENKAMLEDALNNKNNEIVEIALVNLIYNQGGSDKVRQYLLNQFRGPTNLLADSDFDMQLAAQLNDPQVNVAAQSVDDRTGSSRWAYFEDRKNWSIYTWIDDYTVDLNANK